MSLHRNDILWKGILEDLFVDFLRFFYPNAEEIFDLDRGFEFLDKELEQLFPTIDPKHPKFVDKLVKVYKKNGKEKWFLVHIEVQGYEDKQFPLRMFTYFYRILDRYGRKVSSIAIFTDKDPKYHPKVYKYNFEGASVAFRFRTYKVIEQDKKALAQSDNPFAVVILTVLLALEKETLCKEELLSLSLDLMRRMYQKGFAKEKIRQLLIFIKSFIHFDKPEIINKFDNEIDILNNKTRTMGIIEQVTQMRIEEATLANKTVFVKNLLQKTNHSLQEIADIAEVSIDFILEVKKTLPSN